MITIEDPIPMREWGKDHWSTLAYVETRCVDHDGWLRDEQMRGRDVRYPTRGRPCPHDEAVALQTAGGRVAMRKEFPMHSDWDCVADMYAHGLLEPVGDVPEKVLNGRVFQRLNFQKHARLKLTYKGGLLCGALRAHKAEGGNFHTFVPPDVEEQRAALERLGPYDCAAPTRSELRALELLAEGWVELRALELLAGGWVQHERIMHVTLNRLEAAGWIVRDRLDLNITITDAGREVLAAGVVRT